MIGVLGVIYLCENVIFNPVISVFILIYQEEFGWTRGSIAGAITVGALMGAAITPLVGGPIDRFGARRFLAAGCLLIGLCAAGLAFVTELWQFWVLIGIAQAAAVSVVSLGSVAVVSVWFRRRRGLATAFMLMGQRIGAAILPLVILALIVVVGWRNAWWIMGLAVLAVTVLPVLWLVRDGPAQVGSAVDGIAPGSSPNPAEQPMEPSVSRSEAIRMPSFYLIIVGNSLFFMVIGALNLHLAPYLQGRGLSAGTAVAALSCYGITAAVTSIAWGWIGDRWGVRRALTVCLIISAAAVAYLLTVQDEVSALLFALMGGSVIGGGFALCQVITADFFGSAHLGAIRGAMNLAIWPLNALGPLAAGVTFDLFDSYVPAFIGFVVCCLLAAAATALAPRPQRATVQTSA